jgi:hypothetical protein
MNSRFRSRIFGVPSARMGWTMLYLFVALKIPILAAIYIVWWAVKQEPDPNEDARDDGGTKKRPHPVPRRGPKPPRRDPHGAPEPPSPPRVRTVKARGRQIKR